MSYILLVEDNQMNADMVIRILQSASLEVRHALKGLEGAQMARKDRPDLILMDFDLPDVDGRTMALVLKKQLGGDAAPPIVAVTARSGDAEMRIAQKFGCVAFVSKPFVPEEFLSLVKSLLAKNAKKDPASAALRTSTMAAAGHDPAAKPDPLAATVKSNGASSSAPGVQPVMPPPSNGAAQAGSKPEGTTDSKPKEPVLQQPVPAKEPEPVASKEPVINKPDVPKL